MATTRKDLENLVNELALISGKATSEHKAIELKQDQYLFLEYASAYGGYRLVNVKVGSGGHSGAFGMSDVCSRLKAPVMEQKLRGIISGIEYQKAQ